MSAIELEEVFKNKMAEERREYLRFGLIAATIVNVNRRKGAPLVKPGDFFRTAPKESDFMAPKEAEEALAAWVLSTQTATPQHPPEGWEGNTVE